MLEQVYPDIFCNKITLPKSPLKTLNSYIVVSPGRSLIIDTGFNHSECEEALLGGIAELGLDLNRTDVLLTHRHSDHTGLARVLEQRGARILAGARESVAIGEMNGPEFWSRISRRITLYGLEKFGIALGDLPGYKYRSQTIDCCAPLSEGDQLNYGGYTFSVIDIPGHTPGHIGLYETENQLFFCGDHILSAITPNITFWGFEQDSLAQYLSSLRKVRAMPIRRLFTAHRETVCAHPETRIDQLIAHHETRLAEVMRILERGSQCVAEVASRMTWEIRAKGWDEFPKPQKWFASGEAASHLEYLFNSGRIHRIDDAGTMYYQLKA